MNAEKILAEIAAIRQAISALEQTVLQQLPQQLHQQQQHPRTQQQSSAPCAANSAAPGAQAAGKAAAAQFGLDGGTVAAGYATPTAKDPQSYVTGKNTPRSDTRTRAGLVESTESRCREEGLFKSIPPRGKVRGLRREPRARLKNLLGSISYRKLWGIENCLPHYDWAWVSIAMRCVG